MVWVVFSRLNRNRRFWTPEEKDSEDLSQKNVVEPVKSDLKINLVHDFTFGLSCLLIEI